MRRGPLRAVVTLGIVWALAWLPVGVALALYAAARPPQPDDLLHRPVNAPLFVTVWTLWGWFSGAMFAVILGRQERRRTLSELSLGRTAAWGSLGAMVLPVLLAGYDVLRGWTSTPLYSWRPAIVSLIVGIGLGAASAVSTLVLARRAPAPSGRTNHHAG